MKSRALQWACRRIAASASNGASDGNAVGDDADADADDGSSSDGSNRCCCRNCGPAFCPRCALPLQSRRLLLAGPPGERELAACVNGAGGAIPRGVAAMPLQAVYPARHCAAPQP